jgi:ATP adenylyltransferase
MPRSKPGANAAGLRLWAPWRYTYLKSANSRSRACIFCFGKLGAAERRRRLVLYQGPQALIMLNRYPYNNGHLMVAPRRHLASLEMLSAEERALLAELVTASVIRLKRRLRPAGFNVGANLGRTAGAGFADHLHWHIVPRWDGDTSFMPVLASTRVLSEHLEASFKSLAPLFKAIESQIF